MKRREPRYILLRLLGLWLLACCVFNCQAQQEKKFSGEFRDLRFEEFARMIEAQSDYRFFFDSAELDSIRVNVSVHQVGITSLLNQVFRGTGLNFSIDSLLYVVVGKKSFRPEIASNFFNSGDQGPDSAQTETELFEETVGGRPSIKSASENKLYVIGVRTGNLGGKATLVGYVRDSKNGEAIAGASVTLDSLSSGVATDQFGYYSIILPKGRHTLYVSSAGMKESRRQIQVYGDGKMNIDLQDAIVSLKAVTVLSQRNSNIRSLNMGTVRVSAKAIQLVPVVFGEADILKVVLTLPGVTSVGEASAGFNVRGGATDQNLILFNDATIYNATHLFGFFSAFDANVVKEIELYKSAIPEKYGGRLSSVLDVTMKDGNNQKWSGMAGINPLTSNLTLEGPLDKGKTSVIMGGRTTYSDWILHSLPNGAYNRSNASFYDLNFHLTHNLNAKNYLYLTGYLSRDNFNFNNDTLYKYGNTSINAKWRHIFNYKFFGVLTLALDKYQYSVSSQYVPANAYDLRFDINQKSLRADFNYKLNDKHALSFGLQSIYYLLHPGTYVPIGNKSLVTPDTVPQERALETALYLGDTYNISSKFAINAGIRYSLYNYLGPHEVYQYASGEPKSVNTIADTLYYSAGKVIKTYGAPEVRLSLKYELTGSSSVKLSYNTMRQYIHMLSNTTAISPTDIWKLSDPNIQPQAGEQFSVGYYQNLKSNTIEFSVEAYYKNIQHYLDYKSGARLLLNDHIETDVINSRGKAYGIEVLLKKTTGKLNGWLSYTYSRTFLRSDDPNAGPPINQGNYYPADFDKPHSANLIANYQFSHRISVSTNVVYSTGRPITLPLATFNIGGATSLYYSERNQYRIPDYFRTDLSLNLDGNHRVKQKIHNSWTFGVYNLTARQNAYSVYFTNENGNVKGYQLSIFGTAIPYITYHLKF